MTLIEEMAREIIGMARMLAGETVDGLSLKDEPDTKLAEALARKIRLRAGHIEDYIKNPM